MRSRLLSAAALLGTLGLAMPLAGCNGEGDALTKEQHQQTDRLADIANKAQGDWSRVSPEDRDYVIKTFGIDENGAKMLILRKYQKPGGPGGPGAPGGPGGPGGGPPQKPGP